MFLWNVDFSVIYGIISENTELFQLNVSLYKMYGKMFCAVII
jgi:hypothetical protein